MFKGDPVTDMVLRGATSAADTATSGWASNLAGIAIYDFIQSITSGDVLGECGRGSAARLVCWNRAVDADSGRRCCRNDR